MIAVLATCHNRRETTLRGLAALRDAADGVPYRVFLVDDGSTDGTAAAVRARFPEVTVIAGDGTLYWCGGMRVAWAAALPAGADHYLWWNDDLALLPGALARLLAMQHALAARHGPKLIAIGKVVDPETGATTYGGYLRRPGPSRLAFRRVGEGGTPCVTMNGNCVLIPARAVADVGLLDERFTHDSGDVDYGLRASRAGYRLVQSDFAAGHTAFNHAFHAGMSRLAWSNRRFVLRDPKGIRPREWLHFCRKHGGWLWPANFLFRYLKILRLRA